MASPLPMVSAALDPPEEICAQGLGGQRPKSVFFLIVLSAPGAQCCVCGCLWVCSRLWGGNAPHMRKPQSLHNESGGVKW